MVEDVCEDYGVVTLVVRVVLRVVLNEEWWRMKVRKVWMVLRMVRKVVRRVVRGY